MYLIASLTLGSEVSQHLPHQISVGAPRDIALLGSLHLGGSNHLHGPGDLGRALNGADTPPQLSNSSHLVRKTLFELQDRLLQYLLSLGTELFTDIDPGSETGRPSKRRISTTVGRMLKSSGMGDLVAIDSSDARYQGVQQFVVKDAAWWDLLSNITGLKQVDLAFQQAEELEARDDLAPNQKRRMLARIARAIGLSTQTSSVQTRALFARYRASKEMEKLGLVDGPLDPQRIESQRMQRDEEGNR